MLLYYYFYSRKGPIFLLLVCLNGFRHFLSSSPLYLVFFLLLPGPGITAPEGPHTPMQLLPITTRRLSPSLSPSPLSLKRSAASEQVTGRGLAARSREAGRASLATAVLRSLSVCDLLRFSIRQKDTKRGTDSMK